MEPSVASKARAATLLLSSRAGERGWEGRPIQEKCRSHQFMPQVPGDRRTNAHRNADAQLAIWNLSQGISVMPATIGTLARKGPEKRPITTAHTPQRSKNLWPFSISFGYRLSGHMPCIWA